MYYQVLPSLQVTQPTTCWDLLCHVQNLPWKLSHPRVTPESRSEPRQGNRQVHGLAQFIVESCQNPLRGGGGGGSTERTPLCTISQKSTRKHKWKNTKYMCVHMKVKGFESCYDCVANSKFDCWDYPSSPVMHLPQRSLDWPLVLAPEKMGLDQRTVLLVPVLRYRGEVHEFTKKNSLRQRKTYYTIFVCHDFRRRKKGGSEKRLRMVHFVWKFKKLTLMATVN